MRLDRVCLTYRREEVRTGAVNYPLIILAGAVINFRRNATRSRKDLVTFFRGRTKELGRSSTRNANLRDEFYKLSSKKLSPKKLGIILYWVLRIERLHARLNV